MRNEPLQIDVVTLFPQFFESPLSESMLKIAQDKKAVQVRTHDIRDYAHDKHRTCDDAPYGGGPGMVMKPEPVFECIEDVKKDQSGPVIYMTPQGEPVTQNLLHELADLPGFIILCGHYEGVDQRIRDNLVDREVSLGDFVLTGGEIPALSLIDGTVRLIPGVLGNDESIVHESFQTEMLDHPHYTRPQDFRGWRVPDVLTSGNHAEIEKWRKEQAQKNTEKRKEILSQKINQKG